MSKTIRQLYEEHQGKVSDKWSLYLDEWDRIFSPYRDQPVNLLEIGVQNGGSLEIWAKAFVNAEKIVGCDIDPKCELLKFDDSRIKLVIGDANSDECERKILEQIPTFDILVDDGSHKSDDIIRSFARYFPHLSDNGIYIIEDLHSSYWVNFGGGFHNPLSAMAFFKRLTDIINYEHWRNNKSRASLLTKFSEEYDIEFDDLNLNKIHSIEFINSLCILRKCPPASNILGKRVIVGSEDSVVNDWKKYDGIMIQDLATDIKDDANLDVFELISQINTLTQTTRNLEQSNSALTGQVANDEHALQRLQAQAVEQESVLQTLQAQVIEKEQAVQALQAQIIESDQAKQNLADQISKKERLFVEYAERIMNAEQTIQSLTADVTAKGQAEQNATRQIQELAEIKSSHAWRLVKLIWLVRSSLRFKGKSI